MNLTLDEDIETEMEIKDEFMADTDEAILEIKSISMTTNDIDITISTVKRRKQQKAHPTYELIKSPIIVILCMTHKRIMCHSIRGRQRGKRKKKFQQYSFY